MKKIVLAALLLASALPFFAQHDRGQQQKPPKPSVVRKGLMGAEKVGRDWVLVVPDSLLGKDMLTTTRFISTPSETGAYGGEQLQEQTVFWELNPDSMLVLRARMTVNVADTTQRISRAVTVANENPIIGLFEVTEHKDKARKIKVNQFFLEDAPALGFSERAKQQLSMTGVHSGLSYIEDIKSFPGNVEVQMVKTFVSRGTSNPSAASTGRMTFRLNVSFILLPEVPMLRRYFDPRVGYFTNAFTEYSDDQQRVKSKQFVCRWRLEPKSDEDWDKMAAGELIEPKKPIVYYIDPATPKRWRPYLIQGVNDWQKAFEKAGWKNAIRAEEWPEGDSTMSMEDARYSVIRYLASPIENAYGPHVSDPRTGEILESHICWYHNVMSLVHDWYMVQASSIDEAARKMHFDDALMGELIRFVASHEVGHTLGLRHNFGSSSTVPVDSLRNKSFVIRHGHTPSIMDYARFNYVAQPEDGIGREGIFPRIGDYDLWAIEWGYRPMRYAIDEDLDHQLEEPLTYEAQKNPRLWWGDGETYHNDPRRQREDLGDDAVKASEYGIRNLKRELRALPQWTDETMDYFGVNLPSMYNQVLSQFLRYVGHVAHNIGGTRETFRTPLQGGTLYEPNPLERQKVALDFINRHCFQEPVWLRDVPYLKQLTYDTEQITLIVARRTVMLITDRLSSDRLNRLWPLRDVMGRVTDLIMKEAQSGARVSRYRRELQNRYAQWLIDSFRNADATDPDRPTLLLTLERLRNHTMSASRTTTDATTRAHWLSLYDLISRALKI